MSSKTNIMLITSKSKEPVIFLYPLRVLPGSTNDTIMRIALTHFFSSNGFDKEAREIANANPGKELGLYEELLNGLIKQNSNSLTIRGVTLTPLSGKLSTQYYDLIKSSLAKAYKHASRVDPEVHRAISELSKTTEDGKTPLFIYRKEDTISSLEEVNNYRDSFYGLFTIKIGDSKPKQHLVKPNLFNEVILSVAEQLEDDVDERMDDTTGEVMEKTDREKSYSTVPTETVIKLINDELHINISPDGTLTPSETAPSSQEELTRLLQLAFQTTRGKVKAEYPSMLLPTSITDGVINACEMLGEYIGQQRNQHYQIDLQVLKDDIIKKEPIPEKEGALKPVEISTEDMGIFNPYGTHSFIPLNGSYIPLVIE